MTLRLFTTPLLLATLLLGTLGCSKKETPVPSPPAGTASYQLSGRTISCNAKLAILPNINGTSFEVICTTTPQPANGEELLLISYFKPTGKPTFEPSHMIYVERDKNGNQLPGIGFSFDNSTLTETSTGGYSATFSGSPVYSTYPVITTGVFTDLHP